MEPSGGIPHLGGGTVGFRCRDPATRGGSRLVEKERAPRGLSWVALTIVGRRISTYASIISGMAWVAGSSTT
jgi:hypothetical protein